MHDTSLALTCFVLFHHFVTAPAQQRSGGVSGVVDVQSAHLFARDSTFQGEYIDPDYATTSSKSLG